LILTPIYEVVFRPRAAKAFQKLNAALQRQLARKLIERSRNPRVLPDAVREIPNGYKIKLRSSGFRLVYMVRDGQMVILVLSIGKREREEAYKDAITEFGKLNDPS
jgi:mRNA interferase RelE/StbE